MYCLFFFLLLFASCSQEADSVFSEDTQVDKGVALSIQVPGIDRVNGTTASYDYTVAGCTVLVAKERKLISGYTVAQEGDVLKVRGLAVGAYDLLIIKDAASLAGLTDKIDAIRTAGTSIDDLLNYPIPMASNYTTTMPTLPFFGMCPVVFTGATVHVNLLLKQPCAAVQFVLKNHTGKQLDNVDFSIKNFFPTAGTLYSKIEYPASPSTAPLSEFEALTKGTIANNEDKTLTYYVHDGYIERSRLLVALSCSAFEIGFRQVKVSMLNNDYTPEVDPLFGATGITVEQELVPSNETYFYLGRNMVHCIELCFNSFYNVTINYSVLPWSEKTIQFPNFN